MRLIDADELIEHVWRDRLDSRERIANLVESMPTIQDRWIPVTERLPEEEGCYLVSVKNDHQRKYSKTAWFNNGLWTMVRQKVLAWRPLPEPYTEDKA